jgi:hypothetical protein
MKQTNNGKDSLFESYRIRVATIVRDYTASEREEAPEDSRKALDAGGKP